MKKLSLLFGAIVLFVLMSSADAQDFVPGQIMIDIKHQYLPISPTLNVQGVIETSLPSIDSLNVLYGVCDFQAPLNTSSQVSRGFYLLKFPDSLNADQVLSSYLADIHINMGSLNYIRHPDLTPEDYYFPQQWGLSKMKCPEAWRYTNGSSRIVIQIIDGGTDYGHPDLVHNIWQNSGIWPYGEDWDEDGHTIEWNAEENKWVLDPGDLNNSDDDDNGYRDDLVGWDFRDGDRDPQPERILEPHPWDDHGDKTAGTAAAVTDNWINSDEADWVCWNDTGTVAGTSWFSKIMIARMWDDWDAIDAIDYAMNKGARIISMSWSHSGDNPQLHAKLDEAWDTGLLLIASAGGQSSETPRYPAAYPSVIAVAGTDENDVKADKSNYGTWVDICAPSSNVAPDRGKYWDYYCYDLGFSGTSCSAPFVAGVAALAWSCELSATNAEVREALESTADNIDGLNPGYAGLLGSGRVNALEAVKVFRPFPPPPGDCNADLSVDLGDVLSLNSYLYRNGPAPNPLCIGDVNDDGVIDLGDVLYLINYLYKNGPAPLDACD